jgi:membrane associated rhomboid family serine protease
MNTAPQATGHRPASWLLLTALLYLAAGAVCGVLGYDFARQAGGGFGMALLAGANAALFGTLLADALASRLVRRR